MLSVPIEVQVAELRAEFKAVVESQNKVLERLTQAVENQSETLGSLKENLHRTDLLEERLKHDEVEMSLNTAFRERLTGAGIVLGSAGAIGAITAILRLLILKTP